MKGYLRFVVAFVTALAVLVASAYCVCGTGHPAAGSPTRVADAQTSSDSAACHAHADHSKGGQADPSQPEPHQHSSDCNHCSGLAVSAGDDTTASLVLPAPVAILHYAPVPVLWHVIQPAADPAFLAGDLTVPLGGRALLRQRCALNV